MRASHSKYGAVKTVVDGVTFASRKEARRYAELLLLQKAGEISFLELQPKYPLHVFGKLICTYVADFAYREHPEKQAGTWLSVVEDCKGVRTPIYAIKRKLLNALTGIEIRET